MEQIERSEVEKAAAVEAATLDRIYVSGQYQERVGARITDGFGQLQASEYLTGNERWEN